MRKGGTIMKFVAVIVTVVLGIVAAPTFGQWSTPVPVPEVNTEFNEKTFFLSSDSKTLYFARQDTDTYHQSRLFAATRPGTDGPFTEVTQLGDFGPGHVESPWVSPDNLRLYYYRAEAGNNWRVKMSERASVYDPWLPGSNITELNNFGDIARLTLTADELTIVFNLLETPTHWYKNLWMATRPDRQSPFGNFTQLTSVNAPGDDTTPYLSPDGLTLYFSSTRNTGAYQIFRAQRSSLTEPFGSPVHLSFFDTPVGSSAYPALSSDGSTMFFGRWLSGETTDIYVSYFTPPALPVDIDIKPGSCPNPLNPKSRGVLPVAVLGSDGLDVTEIDPASIRLAGVPALRSSYEDVAAPIIKTEDCDCAKTDPDGYTDLVLKFDTQEIVATLPLFCHSDTVPLPFNALLNDGTPVEGSDCVVIKGKPKRLPLPDNLLINPGFETQEDIPSDLPADFGYWARDYSVITTATDGVAPRSGDRMVRFINATPGTMGPYLNNKAGELHQLVDVSSYSDLIAAGDALALSFASFNRIPGDDQTDTLFRLVVRAYAGDPDTYPVQNTGYTELAKTTTEIYTDDLPDTWQRIAIDMPIPVGTDFISVLIYAGEDVFDDGPGAPMDFHGHFADDIFMGVIEAQPCMTFPCAATLVGDLNADCYVDSTDLAILLQHWLDCANPFDPACTE